MIAKSAAKDIKKCTPVLRKRLQTKLTFYAAQDDPLAAARKLVDSPDAEYRFHIGNYRILFDVDGDTIVVLRVQHRSEVYR